MINSVYVHIDLQGSIVLCGQLIIDPIHNRMGSFKYARKYCRHPLAYSLDPIHLPLAEGAIYETPITRHNMGIPQALLDAAPDSWGKKVLIALLDPPPTNNLEFLVAGSGLGVGSLYFSLNKNAYDDDHVMQNLNDIHVSGGALGQSAIDQFNQLDSPAFGDNVEVIAQTLPREFMSLEDILETAMAIDQGKQIDRQKAIFFEYGSSLGGARPKSLIDEFTLTENGYEWKRWIVKFRGKQDLVNYAVLEHESMQMARDAGCNVADSKVVDTALGSLLLVERFDINAKGHKSQLLSAYSLINDDSQDRFGSSRDSYPNIAHISDQICEESEKEELFRRMLVNIALGNVDDHLKNHAFVTSPGSKPKLSPAYDVLPTIGLQCSPQAIAISQQDYRQTPDNIAQCAAEMGIDPGDAAEIAEDVLSATVDWENRFRRGGLNPKEIVIAGASLQAREFVKAYLNSIPESERNRLKNVTSMMSI